MELLLLNDWQTIYIYIYIYIYKRKDLIGVVVFPC
jgi:hypothetical protein